VQEGSGMGHLFMPASTEPLDFSQRPFDSGQGWDLRAIGEVVYEKPYVAIADYVAVFLPRWNIVRYSLNFFSYSVSEA
jgi:hypothetical protein